MIEIINPKISIVTPCFNSEKFIHRLHDSLCRQEYKNFEWVLVDDCSTDNTLETLKKLTAPGYGGIKLYALPQNSGGGVAMGLGVEKSRGEMVILIDHDDELFESALSSAISDWECIAARDDLAGIFCRRFNPVLGDLIGEELEPGTVFSMSWLHNVKPSICDGVLLLKSAHVKKYFNTRTLEAICLSGVPLNLMTKTNKLVAGGSSPLVIYHRDNPDSQTNNIKISRKTVYTYAKYIDAYDIHYLRRPVFWIRHIVALIKFSMLIYRNPIYYHRYIKSSLVRAISYLLLPIGVVRYYISRKDKVIDFPSYNLKDLDKLKNIYVTSREGWQKSVE